MASGENDLNSRERPRWSNSSKVYTRKNRKTRKDTNTDDTAATTVDAAAETVSADVFNEERDKKDSTDVPQPSSQTLEEQPRQHQDEAVPDEEAKPEEQQQEQPRQHQDEAVPYEGAEPAEQPLEQPRQHQDEAVPDEGAKPAEQLLEQPRQHQDEAVPDEGAEPAEQLLEQPRQLQDEAVPQAQDHSTHNFAREGETDPEGGAAREDGTTDEQVQELNAGVVREGGGDPIPEHNGREVQLRDGTSSSLPALQNDREVLPREHLEAANGLVKPIISRVADRVRICLTGVRSRAEIRELKRSLESDLDHVRNLVKRLEAEELQLTAHRSAINSGNDTGSIAAIPGGAFGSYNRPQYSGVIKSRSLVRVNSDVGSVGHPEPRPFRPPSLTVAVNNHGADEFVKEKRTPKANQYYRNSEFLLGKDRLPPESNKKLKPNGSGKKHSGASEYEFAFGNGFGHDKHKNKLLRSCSSLLQRLMKHKHGWLFNEPVNVEAFGLQDYHDIIKHPMDLGTIKTRLSQKFYKSPREFSEDVRLVFRNAMTYNPEGHEVHVMAEQLLQIFEERWSVIEAEYNPNLRYQMYHDAALSTPTSRKAPHPPPFAPDPQVRTLDRSESMTWSADPKTKPSHFAHVGRTPVPKKPKATDPNKRDMTYEEKQKLSSNLQSLPPEKLDAIVQIIKKRNSTLNQHDDEIEVDIDSVDAETLWELDRFVTNYKKSLSKNRRKAELALQARTRAAQSAPVTNSAPVVADALKESRTGEMDASAPATRVEGGRQADNASRSSSSSSSSSDSGSSSSDSDSDSSSASGSDAGHSPKT